MASDVISKSTDSMRPVEIKPAPRADASPDPIVADPASLLPDLPPVPRSNATLVGGTIEHLDRVRDEVTLSVFGGGRTTALFDPRTRVFNGTKEVTIADLREGQRVYLDTILDGNTVFARNIRVDTHAPMGECRGTVLEFRPERGELTIRDALSPAGVRVRVNSSTRFMEGNRSVTSSTLLPGSLITVTFNSQGSSHDVAQEVSILALPGSHYRFAGRIIHVDLRSGLLVLNSSTDNKNYEVYLDPSMTPDGNLHFGANVTIAADFDGTRYVARNVTVESPGK